MHHHLGVRLVLVCGLLGGACYGRSVTCPAESPEAGNPLPQGRCLCDRDGNQFTYTVDPQPRAWLKHRGDTKSLSGQCDGSDLADGNAVDDISSYRNFTRAVNLGRTFYHPNYLWNDYSESCGTTTCLNSTDGIGGVTYEVSDLSKNVPHIAIYLALPDELKFGFGGSEGRKCWGDEPWYQLQPGFAFKDAVANLCNMTNVTESQCSSSLRSMDRITRYQRDCVTNASWFVYSIINSLAVINEDNVHYNDPSGGTYSWEFVQGFFTLQDLSTQFVSPDGTRHTSFHTLRYALVYCMLLVVLCSGPVVLAL